MVKDTTTRSTIAAQRAMKHQQARPQVAVASQESVRSPRKLNLVLSSGFIAPLKHDDTMMARPPARSLVVNGM
jgi:hypothetical protein